MERHSKRGQAGFTLIELAIAIGVMAILIGGIVLGTRFLGSGAKVSKVLEYVEKIQTGAGLCKMKNSAGFTGTGFNFTTLSTMLQDSQCRTTGTGVPDGNGYITSPLTNYPSGITNATAIYSAGTLTLTLTAEDNDLASQIQAELVKKISGATVNNNTITIPIRL